MVSLGCSRLVVVEALRGPEKFADEEKGEQGREARGEGWFFCKEMNQTKCDESYSQPDDQGDQWRLFPGEKNNYADSWKANENGQPPPVRTEPVPDFRKPVTRAGCEQRIETVSRQDGRAEVGILQRGAQFR